MLLALYLKLDAVDQRTRAVEVTPEPVITSNLSSDFRLEASTAASMPNGLNESQLRWIIREELAAQLGDFQSGGTRSEPDIVLSPREIAEYERRRDDVAERINYFSSIGNISDMEMQQLQSEIARLDNAGRKEMLGRLIRAMNAGEIKGNL